MSFIRIREVVPLEGFRVRLTLTDGNSVERDLSRLLAGPIFDPISRDESLFREVRVEQGALVWPNGADLCPDVVIWGGRTVLSVLDAVYVDVDRERVVTIQPKADFLPLLAAASPGWGLAGKRLLHGDPDGIRGYHAQWPFVAQVGGADVLLWVA